MFESLRPEFWLQLAAYMAMLAVAYFGLRQTVAVLSEKHDSLDKKVEDKMRGLEEKVDEKTENLQAILREANREQNKKIEKLGELLVQSARYEERQANTDKQILMLRSEFNELKHGQGFINGPRLANSGIP